MAAGESLLLALWCCASVVLIADGVRLGDELKDVDEDSLSPAAAAYLLTRGIVPQMGPDNNPFGIRTKKRLKESGGGLHKTQEKDDDADHPTAHSGRESLHQDHGSSRKSESASSETQADFRNHVSKAFDGGKNKGDGEGDGDQHGDGDDQEGGEDREGGDDHEGGEDREGGDDHEGSDDHERGGNSQSHENFHKNPDDKITDKPPDMQKDILGDPNYKNRHEIEFHKDMHGHINVHVDKRKIAENYWDLHGWEYRNGQKHPTSNKKFRHGMEQS